MLSDGSPEIIEFFGLFCTLSFLDNDFIIMIENSSSTLRIKNPWDKQHFALKKILIAFQWKKMFASRFLLHQNWLKGKCNVRTFEGHTQGNIHYKVFINLLSRVP